MSRPAAEPATVLVPMDATHLDVILRLETELFADQAWSAQTLRDELADPSRHYVVALASATVVGGADSVSVVGGADSVSVVGGAGSTDSAGIVGYAGLAAYDDEAHVMTVGVLPPWRRTGVASAMLVDLLAAAGTRRVILEVGEDNLPAQHLYRRHGFTVVGARRHYFGPGSHAVVMARPPAGGRRD